MNWPRSRFDGEGLCPAASTEIGSHALFHGWHPLQACHRGWLKVSVASGRLQREWESSLTFEEAKSPESAAPDRCVGGSAFARGKPHVPDGSIGRLRIGPFSPFRLAFGIFGKSEREPTSVAGWPRGGRRPFALPSYRVPLRH